MALSKQLLTYIESKLPGNDAGHQIAAYSPVSGGSINQVYCLQTQNAKYLLKVNSKSKFPGMFQCEADGLNAIADTQTIAVPKVLSTGETDDDSFLLLEWVDTERARPSTSHLLGQQLAQMHRHTADNFGFDANNYMGSLPQSNKKHFTWSTFFIEERLMPMVKTAVDNRLLNITDNKNFEKLYAKLPQLFDEEKPSLIHGDLWSGNYLIGVNGKPYLIDPAVSYGHREFDIAMTTLFGGFSADFYTGYNESFPLAGGWEQRLDLWNLYPLLLHLNLFGIGYLGQVRGYLNGYILIKTA